MLLIALRSAEECSQPQVYQLTSSPTHSLSYILHTDTKDIHAFRLVFHFILFEKRAQSSCHV